MNSNARIPEALITPLLGAETVWPHVVGVRWEALPHEQQRLIMGYTPVTSVDRFYRCQAIEGRLRDRQALKHGGQSAYLQLFRWLRQTNRDDLHERNFALVALRLRVMVQLEQDCRAAVLARATSDTVRRRAEQLSLLLKQDETHYTEALDGLREPSFEGKR